MENSNKNITSVINFKDFFKSEFDESIEVAKNDIKEYISKIKNEDKSEELIKEDISTIENEITEEIEEEIEEKIQQIVEDSYYSIFKDKTNDFKFEIFPEGDAKKASLKGRIIIESDDWSLVFNGDIDKKGICTIPIKKIDILQEGTIGKIRVEVIADDSIFVPWEDEFKVKVSKKVSIKMNETKTTTPNPIQLKSGVSINIKK